MVKKTKTTQIAFLAIFTSIIVLQTAIPVLGYIPIGPINVTLLHITVAIAAIVLGPKLGSIIGLFWGLGSMIRAFVLSASPFSIAFTNPFISVLPRFLDGLLVAYIFIFLKKYSNLLTATFIAGISSAILNTLFVSLSLFLFYHNSNQMLLGINMQHFFPLLLALMGTNFIPEVIAAGFIVPAISIPLVKYLRLHK